MVDVPVPAAVAGQATSAAIADQEPGKRVG